MMADFMWKARKPKCGMLFLECRWFKSVGMGSDVPGGDLCTKVRSRTEAICEDLSTDLDVVYPDLISDVPALREAMKRFIAEEVDFVLASFTTWTEDFAWVRFLRDFPADIPVLFWCLQGETIDFVDNISPNNFTEFLLNTGLVGSLEGSGSVQRTGASGRVVKSICGSVRTCRDRVTQFGRAAKARAILRRSRLGLLQSFNEVMWSTYVDPYRFFLEAGPEIQVVSFESLRKAAEAVPPSDADKMAQELNNKYHVQDDVDPRLFRESVRASIGLASLARERSLDAIAFNDVDDSLHETLGLRPGFYHPDFDRAHSVVVPEADVGMAALALALRMMTGQPAVFVEPFFLDENNNTFAAGHAGPNNHAAARAEDVIIMPDAEYENSDFKYAGAPFACFTVPPGIMTMVHLGQSDRTFKLVSGLVESVPPTCQLKGYAGGMFHSEISVNEFFEQLLRAGVTQHYLVVAGDWGDQLRDFAMINEFENVEVG
jgi:L-arabinose isomerase